MRTRLDVFDKRINNRILRLELVWNNGSYRWQFCKTCSRIRAALKLFYGTVEKANEALSEYPEISGKNYSKQVERRKVVEFLEENLK